MKKSTGTVTLTPNARRKKSDKSAGRNVGSLRIASENSSHTKPVSHTDSETREPTVQFSDRRPYSLVQFTDSLGRTDSRRRRTHAHTRAIFPQQPTKLPIVNGHLAYVAVREEIATFPPFPLSD